VDLDALRHQIEGFLRQLAEEEYLQQAGLKSESQFAGIYQQHEHLFHPTRLEELRAAMREGGGTTGPRLLLEFLTHACLEAKVQDVTDRFLREEATAFVSVEERMIPLRGAEAAIRDEADRARRSRLEQALAQVIDRLNPLLRERLAGLQEAVTRLGGVSYPALWEELSGVHLDDLEKLIHPLLARTEEMYADVLKWMLKRTLGVALSEATRHDLARLFRAPEYDRLLPLQGVAAAVETSAQHMRIDPRAAGRIQIDAEVRQGKTYRAFVAPIEVPKRVILVVRPGGGWGDASAYLHELGHALHFANTDPALPVEFRRLGDASLTEAFAFLLEGLLLEPGFVRRVLGIPRERDFLRVVALHKLYLLRRYAAKLIYERGLYDGRSPAQAAEAYRGLVSRATAAEFPPELYLYDVDPAFYVARYLRAWILEAQLREQLYERFDEEWYRNDRTGPFLLDLWCQGLAPTAESLAMQLGLGPLQIDPLIRSVARHLD
jgi:hypothetical protein